MTTIGYARVSTTDQDLDIQVAALKRQGCTTIRSRKEICPAVLRSRGPHCFCPSHGDRKWR
jgi:predicted site-specific integrase-resolvase